jgi:hypothetical protein
MKKFLSAFAGVAAAFASNAASNPTVVHDAPKSAETNATSLQVMPLTERITTTDSNGDQFNFVLKRSAETGQMMAWHESHASHSSHSSHSSHYSSR